MKNSHSDKNEYFVEISARNAQAYFRFGLFPGDNWGDSIGRLSSFSSDSEFSKAYISVTGARIHAKFGWIVLGPNTNVVVMKDMKISTLRSKFKRDKRYEHDFTKP